MSQMNVNDLAMMVQVIDLATQRGAFRGVELKQIGDLYERLSGFLSEVQKATNQAKEAAATPAPEAGV